MSFNLDPQEGGTQASEQKLSSGTICPLQTDLGRTAEGFKEPSSSRLSSPKTGCPPPLFSLLSHLSQKLFFFFKFSLFFSWESLCTPRLAWNS